MPGSRRRPWIAVLLATGACAAAATPASGAGVYVALGDSPTAGAGAPEGRGYVPLYLAEQKALGGADETLNLAATGATTTAMLRDDGQLERAVETIDEDSDAAVVTLEVGMSDLRTEQCAGGASESRCPFEANFGTILDALLAELAEDPGDEPLQVLQYHNPASGVGGEDEKAYAEKLLGTDLRVDCAGTGAARGLNDVIGCAARAKGAVPVDAYPTFAAGGQALMAAWPDPNVNGHAALACLFAHPERVGSATPCDPEPPPFDDEWVDFPFDEDFSEPLDTEAPFVTLRHREHQRVLKRRGVTLTVLAEEEVTLELRGAVVTRRQKRIARLGAETGFAEAGEPARFTLRLTRKALRRTRAAFRAGRKLSADIVVEAVDFDGNTRTAARRIRLMR